MAIVDWIRIEEASSTGRAEVGSRKIYILPTRYGLIFAALLFLMLLGAVNYGNNPAHLLTFLLAGLGSNAIYQTWRNLRGLRLICHGAAPIFEGEEASFQVMLQTGQRARPAVQLMFEDSQPQVYDLDRDSEIQVGVPIKGLTRGLNEPNWLVLSTRYPLGLFRAWCYLACWSPILVYPKPGQRWTPSGSALEVGDIGEDGSGNEDFAGLREYQVGDQPSRIDWKSFARDRGLNTRLFAGETEAPLWLRWSKAPGKDTETRLRSLCRAVIDAEAAGRAYGLELPEQSVEPGSGPTHRHQCLRLLALHGSTDA